jgi:tetratricopeptide (TPR) repeat protein
MQQLVRETPDDVQAIRTLAEIHAAQRRFQDAAHGYEEITRLEPTDPLTYNVLGYMDGYAHDLAGARAAFDKYRSLTNPSDLNPIDSLGEVYFYNGDFANAEKQFLAAHEFLKAAQARLMTGDLSGADGLFDKSLAQQPQRDLERAQWEFLTGRRKQAMARVEKLATAPGDAGAVATAQLSFWHLQTGDRATATQLASAAFAHATSPAVKNLAAICRFLSQSPAGKSQFANINALALMLNHQFGDAVPILETLLGESNPATDAQVRTLLTWAYVENGKTAQAKPLVDLYIIPLPSAEPAFVSLIFPRFLEVRAKALNTDSKLYDQIKGDLPDRF